jgi:hypothetical protein
VKKFERQQRVAAAKMGAGGSMGQFTQGVGGGGAAAGGGKGGGGSSISAKQVGDEVAKVVGPSILPLMRQLRDQQNAIKALSEKVEQLLSRG